MQSCHFDHLLQVPPISMVAGCSRPWQKTLVTRGKRQQSDIPGLLDGASETALVRGTDSREPPGNNLATLSYEALQQANVAVRDGIDLLGAELANLLAAEKLAAAARTACRTRTACCTISLVAAARTGLAGWGRSCAGLRRLDCSFVGHDISFS
jgi:hypothetical protein